MIGSLTERINLVNPKQIPNGRGGWKTVTGEETRVNIWASYELLSINEQLRYNAMDEAAEVRFIIRDTSAITKDSFIEYNGRAYTIIQIGPAKKIGYTEIRARER